MKTQIANAAGCRVERGLGEIIVNMISTYGVFGKK